MPYLQSIIDHHNRQRAFNTTFKRNEITDENFHEFLSQRFKIDDVTFRYNTSSIDSESFLNPSWRKKLFKYLPGDRVLILVGSDSKNRKEFKIFYKKSISGYWYKQPYVIERAVLRASQHKNMLIPGELEP